MKFKDFELDAFQETAVKCVDHNHSVLVSAPTGSGKTLIADYIIDKNLKEGKRVIYTAPIKALSNQKYHDFIADYGEENIGLITGDLVLNSRAPILIMTTEVYRNMAIIKDPVLDNVSYCIMDEVHFISDEERGYIWEESIIFSPAHIRFLFLSATIPNSDEFSSWVQKIKDHKVDVVKHDRRPVPLEVKFYDVNLGLTTLEAIAEHKELDKFPEYGKGKRRFQNQKVPAPDFRSVVRDIKSAQKLPCIYFAFSRLKTQDFAVRLAEKNDFLSASERAQVSSFISDSAKRLSTEVLTLNSTLLLRECLAKGVAFHHAGLLPDVKHVVELLFAKGLIKVLFATETFAVGINYPAKTVIFDGLRKYTGSGFRYLNSKEFFQIAGRAGRRGMDKVGLAVALINRRGDDLKKIASFTKRDTLPLRSQFKISYNTVLNMIHLHSDDEISHLLMMNFYTFQEGGSSVLTGIRARYDNLVRSLTSLGYIEGRELTRLGLFAKRIFANELEISQIFAGDFMKLDVYSILLVLCAVVYEENKGAAFAPLPFSEKARRLIAALKSHPVLKKGDWIDNIKVLESIMLPCFEQKKFLDVLKNTSMLEGDLIRLFMQIMDRLEQIDRASDDHELISRIRDAKSCIRNTLEGIHMF